MSSKGLGKKEILIQTSLNTGFTREWIYNVTSTSNLHAMHILENSPLLNNTSKKSILSCLAGELMLIICISSVFFFFTFLFSYFRHLLLQFLSWAVKFHNTHTYLVEQLTMHMYESLCLICKIS